MATKLFYRTSPPSYTPTSFQGTWNDTSSVVTIGAGTPRGEKLSVSDSETSTSGTWAMCLLRVVVDIHRSGTVPSGEANIYEVRIGRLNTVASAFVLKSHSWVTQGATSNLRTTLASNVVSTAAWTQTTPTFSGSIASATGDLTFVAGDKLVFELGADANQTVSTSRTATMYYGGNLPASTGSPPADTPDTNSGWISFAGTLETLIAPPQDSSFLPFLRR